LARFRLFGWNVRFTTTAPEPVAAEGKQRQDAENAPDNDGTVLARTSSTRPPLAGNGSRANVVDTTALPGNRSSANVLNTTPCPQRLRSNVVNGIACRRWILGWALPSP
jgi:hypothetical protein